jgi:hypothetical protein
MIQNLHLIGVLLGFSQMNQNEVISDHDQKLLKPGDCGGLESDLHPKAVPQHKRAIKKSMILPKSKERREGQKAKTNSNKKL